jgi:hypothetical protein
MFLFKKYDCWDARITSIEHVVGCKKFGSFISPSSFSNIAGFITLPYQV